MVEELNLNKQTWTLGAELGSGGQGRVYEAVSKDGQSAALKLIPADPGADRELIMHAASAGMRNVIPIWDTGEHNGQIAIVMPRADGDLSLRKYLSQKSSLSAEETIEVLKDVARALEDMAAGGLVHRDLKPENILMVDGHWCVSDFGMARDADASTAKFTFKFHGTREYIAPERWRAERATIAADVYSTGIVGYELLTGTTPFVGPDDSDFHQQHLHAKPPQLPQSVPVSLSTLLLEMLQKPAGARPSPSNLVARLDKIGLAPVAGGLASLEAANEREVAKLGEGYRIASEKQTEAERRDELFGAAENLYEIVSQTTLGELQSSASAATVTSGQRGGWILRLGSGEVKMSAPVRTDPDAWTAGREQRFDVIAHATIEVHQSRDNRSYQGREHSLWYCDAQVEGEYRWFELSFMQHPLLLMGRGSRFSDTTPRGVEPFAMNPDGDGRAAVVGAGTNQLARPFTVVDLSDLGDFIGRWAEMLAKARDGRLAYPSHLPEQDPRGSHR